MEREEFYQELGIIKDRINDVERKLSDFTDALNRARKAETTDNSDAIFELADMVAQLEEKSNG